jgi:putative AlgH/UPF0301 family transcriptional regulator
MTTDYPESLKGHFLMAMPGLLDPNFHQTVICLSEHTRDGAVGIVVNRVHPSLKAEAIFSELEMACRHAIGQAPVYWGGPCMPVKSSSFMAVLLTPVSAWRLRLGWP